MSLFLEEYEKLRLLGKGSFASVYKVRHHDLGYVRAIKVSNDLITDENDHAYRTFLKECRVLLKIGNGCHPNIARIYQPRLIANKAIVEMDYIDGMTLSEYVSAKGFIDMSEFRKFASEVVGAMAFCHADLYKFLMDPEADDLSSDPTDGSRYLIDKEKEKELIAKYCVNHNDLHSNNIMRRNYDGAFILLDFGLAIQDNHCVKSSSRGDGAYEYCSPEKLEGNGITSASDVYSLGILLYEMLAGRVPFVLDLENNGLEKARFEVYTKQLNAVPEPIEPLRKAAFEKANPGKTYIRDYPEELDRIIMKCLSKNPENRYPDAKALLLELNRLFAACDLSVKRDVPALGTSQLEAKISGLERALESERKDNDLLRKQLGSGVAMQNDCRPISRFLWFVAFAFLLVSVGVSFWKYGHTDYWRQSDGTFDMYMVAVGVVSVFCLGTIGFVRRFNSVLWGSCALIMMIVAVMQSLSTFSIGWKLGLCCLSAASILSLASAWLSQMIPRPFSGRK